MIGPITKDEIRIALKPMKNNKAAGRDNITIELLKADMETTVRELKYLFKEIWDNEVISRAWKQSLIVKIPKRGAPRSATTTEESVCYLCQVKYLPEPS